MPGGQLVGRDLFAAYKATEAHWFNVLFWCVHWQWAKCQDFQPEAETESAGQLFALLFQFPSIQVGSLRWLDSRRSDTEIRYWINLLSIADPELVHGVILLILKKSKD